MNCVVYIGKENAVVAAANVQPNNKNTSFFGVCYRCRRPGHSKNRCPLVRCRVCCDYVAHSTDRCSVYRRIVRKKRRTVVPAATAARNSSWHCNVHVLE